MTRYVRLDSETILASFTYLYSEQKTDGSRTRATSDVDLYISESTGTYLVESCITGPAVAID